ncbi:hypothetical protein Q8A73_007450 [Channa argus]|nr:hypothetical protein Q8A73_007450 [Channa argus]
MSEACRTRAFCCRAEGKLADITEVTPDFYFNVGVTVLLKLLENFGIVWATKDPEGHISLLYFLTEQTCLDAMTSHGSTPGRHKSHCPLAKSPAAKGEDDKSQTQ